MINSKHFQETVRRFIELYGDRTQGIGDEIHAGLAWIDDAKFVLIGADMDVVLFPPTWRRISRLFNLAEQLRRPVLLWDTPFQADTAAPTSSLHHRLTGHNTQRHLLKLSVPTIGIFDELPLDAEFAPIDAAVLLQSEPHDDEASPFLVKVATDTATLKSSVLALVTQLSAVPVDALVQQRMDSLRRSVVGA